MQSSFNHLMQLAALICEAPIVAIITLKGEKLDCKSCIGITSEDLQPFHTIGASSLEKADDYHCILNIWNDKRFKTLNRLQHFPNIKSYHSYRVKTKSGKQVGLLVVLKTEEKELANTHIKGLDLIAKQAEKLLELNRKNVSLKKCKKQIEKTSKKADDFASMAAHDLKAPIRNVKSFIELLQNEKDWDDEEMLYFDYVYKSISKMNLLIDGLMDYAKSTIDTSDQETVDLDELVENAFNDIITNHNSTSLSLKKNTLPAIHSHSILLSIVIHNLINNAIKYQNNHPIEITVNYKAEKGYHILEISDNGIGIDEKHFDEIFEPFKRLHTQSEFEGSGLGLASCKRIMKKLKGNISVRSILGQGSTFTIKIPLLERV